MKYQVGNLVRISRFWGSETGIIIFANKEPWLDGFTTIYKILWEDGVVIMYNEDMLEERAFEVIG
jgi:hypothetical protein